LGTEVGEFGLGAGYNSKAGLTSVTITHTAEDKRKGHKDDDDGGVDLKKGLTNSTTLSLAHPGYTPQISMPMRSLNLSTTFKIGGSWWGFFITMYGRGFYNEQWLKNDKKRVKSEAYGYLNYQSGKGAAALLDINREKDGMVIKETPNLAIPSLSYDIYSVTGQGISAMYRPLRNDYGKIHDPETKSKSTGGALGVDVGPAASHIGVNLGVDHSRSISGAWTDRNDLADRLGFQDKAVDDLYEPWYFKVHGESSFESAAAINNIGGDKAVRPYLTGENISPKLTSTIEGRSWSKEAPRKSENRERKPRNQSIQSYTNEELLNGSQEILPHFRITYLDASGDTTKYNRLSSKPHHIAGFTAVTPEGLRYNYGIPAYNITQEEATFSVTKQANDVSRVSIGNENPDPKTDPSYRADGTDKFLKRVEMPSYAHSHLLTSILGPDYVDLKGDGVTTDDLGYWVKFTYINTTTNEKYQWRDPYSKAHFQQGWETDPRDDKGSYVYGTKEIWYLAQAETKSHIAKFHLFEREDGKGVRMRLQNTNHTGKSVFGLQEIKLFARDAGEGNPIKTVKFKQNYAVCKGIDNSATGKGKLTLKELSFEYGSSSKGKLNPYIFDYYEESTAGSNPHNPDYDIHAYDRWGNYKPYPEGKYSHNHDFPYCEQDPGKKEQIDLNAGVWSLKEIQLPSGGKIIVDYESDDYGYVQHQGAMQMMELVARDDDPTPDMITIKDDGRVRFKLETPIYATSLTREQEQKEVLKYLDKKRKQVYFKIRVNLRSPGEGFEEYISGYADINFDETKMGLEKEGDDKYAYGYFHVIKEDGYHPFSMRTWQHLRTNQPDLANSSKQLDATNNSSERIDQIKSLGGLGAQIRQMFEGFYRYCGKQNWGREMKAGQSWIRLNSPDKIKYGGGLRVKQITMQDNWNEDKEGVYGQVYDYTIDEGGKKISSGVASYEPIVGGDENVLRYAKKYVQSIPLRSDNNLFFEYPINETYYPGAQVGYRRVTVTSLAAASLAGITVNHAVFPKGPGISYGTTGRTVHEFYTAKDFPVITDETDKKNKPFRISFPIPLLGSISVSKLSTSQGYSIVTNDMHGKPKKISNYRQDREGNIEPTPISYVKYNYVSNPLTYQQEQVYSVNNIFKENNDGTLSLIEKGEANDNSKFTLGQENEFFADMREFEDNTLSGGVNINIDIVYVLWLTIPVVTPWPKISRSTTQLRTAVTNKVIFKTGVLESVEAFDGGSTVVTKNVKWNKVTGAPVLTKVNNNFDAAVYNYSIPAFSQYQGMGAAYQNIGFTFTLNDITKTTYKENIYEFSAGTNEAHILPGDEILLYTPGDERKDPLARVIFMGKQEGANILYSNTPLAASTYNGMIVRSGYRNQLSVAAGNITALGDPTKKGAPVSHSKTISVPENK
jgi:hypothetical protein